MADRKPQQQAAAAAPPPDDDGGQADGGGRTEAQRLAAVEAAQQQQQATLSEHGGMLHKILAALPGTGEGGNRGGGQDTGPPPLSPGTGPGTPAAQHAQDLRGMVAEEIAAAEQRRQDEKWAEDDDRWRRGVDEFMETVKGEKTPRDPAPGLRGVLQRVTFGKAD